MAITREYTNLHRNLDIILTDSQPTQFHSALQTEKPFPRSVKQLKDDLQTLDDEYNKLSEHIAKGEQEEFSNKPLGYIHRSKYHVPKIIIWSGYETENLKLVFVS